MQVPSAYRLVYTEHAIAERINSLAPDISKWLEQVRQRDGHDALAIPVLRGGLFFCADLVRRLSVPVALEVTKTAAYDETANVIKQGDLNVDIGSLPVRGRSVLLIDDVCESGTTLSALTKALRELGATEVRTAVLIRRQLPNAKASPDWIAFEYMGPEWFVGYGMDDQARFRNLPDVYVISEGSNSLTTAEAPSSEKDVFQ